MWPSLAAGILPLLIAGAADVLIGPSAARWAFVLALLTPAVVALLHVPRFGRRAAWIAVAGYLLALLLAAVATVVAFSALDGS